MILNNKQKFDNIKRITSIFLIFMLFTMCFNSITVNAQEFIDGEIQVLDGVVTIHGPEHIDDYDDATEQVITKYKAFMVFIGGLITVTLVGVMVAQIAKLSASANDPKQRTEAIKGILMSGISASLMGSITMFVGLFYGMFR